MRTAQLLALCALMCAFVGSLAFGAWVKSGAASVWMALTLTGIGLLAAALVVWRAERSRYFE